MEVFNAESALPIITGMLHELHGHDKRLDRQCITGFLGVKGSKYTQKLLVIGQAVNGWVEEGYELVIADASNLEECERHARRLIHYSTLSEPMKWVTEKWEDPEYSTNRSSFWQVVKGVVSRLGITDTSKLDWPEHIAWTNVSKVAPYQGGNPKILLKRHQFDGAQKLLALELDEFQPERVLFLSGLDWALPFLDKLGFIGSGKFDAQYIESAGQIQLSNGRTSEVLICGHPEWKPGTRESWAEEIAGYFNALSD